MIKNYGTLLAPKHLISAEVEDQLSIYSERLKGEYPIFKYKGDNVILPANYKELNLLIGYSGRERVKLQFPAKTKRSLSKPLRSHQITPVKEVVKRLPVEGYLMLRAQCGTGKTVMGLAAAAEIGSRRTMILLDQTNLLEQWQERIEEFLPGSTVHLIGSRYKKKDIPEDVDFIIALAQSLRSEDAETIDVDLLITDEAHVFSAPTFVQAIMNVRFNMSLAMTATDDRKDKLEWIFKSFLGTEVVDVTASTMFPKVYMYPIATAAKEDRYKSFWCNTFYKSTYIAKCESCPNASVRWAGCNVKTERDENMIDMPVLGDKVMWTSMVNDMVMDPVYLEKSYQAIKRFITLDRHALIFSAVKAPLLELHQRIIKEFGEGVSSMYVGGGKVQALESKITLTTYGMSRKGLDAPHKDAMILLTPTADIRQVLGRITRILPNKKQPIVIDFVAKNNGMMYGQSRKRESQYKSLGGSVQWLK